MSYICHYQLWANTHYYGSVLHRGVFLLNLFAVQKCHPFCAGEALRISERKAQAFSSLPSSLPHPRWWPAVPHLGKAVHLQHDGLKQQRHPLQSSRTVVEPLQPDLCASCERCWVTAFWSLHQQVAATNAQSAPILPVFIWLKWQPVQISRARWHYTFQNEYLIEVNSHKYNSENNSTVSRVE